MAKIITFGELMLRLQPYHYERFVQCDNVEFTFGGGEANVAVSLANFGLESRYVTKLPAHAIGQGAVDALRAFGVDTSAIVRGGERIGIYFLEKGASQRSSVCIYDRAGSAIQEAVPSDFDWDRIFEGADWFHFTGITPALGESAAQICLEACKAAKNRGLTISCDLNYRSKLWTTEEAAAVMGQLNEYVDVYILNEEHARIIFGVRAEEDQVRDGRLTKEGYTAIAGQLAERFGFAKVVLTIRSSSSASRNDFSGMLYDGERAYFSRTYHLDIIDRVGGGDAFTAGLIYALVTGKESQAALEFAAAAGALKHSVEGDFNRVSAAEVEALAGGSSDGRIQR